MSQPSFAQWQGDDLTLRCHLQPNALRDEFAGLYGDRLKIRIVAQPIEGRANKQLIAFLAKAFGVIKRDVEILSGELGREKRVRIHGPGKIPAVLAADLPDKE